MISVLKPLTDSKAKGFKLSSKSITPSEANQKLWALEQDLTLMKEQLSELELRYGNLTE